MKKTSMKQKQADSLVSYERSKGETLEQLRDRIRNLRSATKTVGSCSTKATEQLPATDREAVEQLQSVLVSLQTKLRENEAKLTALPEQFVDLISSGASTDGNAAALDTLDSERSQFELVREALGRRISQTRTAIQQRSDEEFERTKLWGKLFNSEVRDAQKPIVTLIEGLVQEIGVLCELSRAINRQTSHLLIERKLGGLRRDWWTFGFKMGLNKILGKFVDEHPVVHPSLKGEISWIDWFLGGTDRDTVQAEIDFDREKIAEREAKVKERMEKRKAEREGNLARESGIVAKVKERLSKEGVTVE